MQFVRKIMDSSLIEDVINLPEELRNRKVEILVLPLEAIQVKDGKRNIFNPENFAGTLKIEEPEKEIESIRNEWERF